MSTSADSFSALPPNPVDNPPPFIYRIVPAADWAETYEKTGRYCGAPMDVRDGYLHISAKEEVEKSMRLYFGQIKDLVLLQLKVPELLSTGHLQWDWVSSRNTYFPHFFDLEGGIQAQHIHTVHKLVYDEENKQHIVPQLE